MKLYERYDASEVLGVISRPGNVALVKSEKARYPKFVLCPGLESVYLWDLKSGELKNAYKDRDSPLAEVRCICVNPDQKGFTSGYSDGSIKMWSINDPELPSTVFNGHHSGITSIGFSSNGCIMAAGSMDTDITVWDVPMERGLYRLRGHRNQITGLKFLSKNGLNHLISCGKDSLIKIWDLATQHCIETLINPSGEVSSLDVDPVRERLLFTTGGTTACVWDLDIEKIMHLTNKGFDNQMSGTAVSGTEVFEVEKRAAIPVDTLERYKTGQTLSVKVSSCGSYIFLNGKDKKLDVFKLLTQKEIEKKAKKNLKRKRDSKGAQGEVSQIGSRTRRMCTISLSQRILSFDTITVSDKSISILANLARNQLSLLEFKPYNLPGDMYTNTSMVYIPGHRLPPRAICLSSDDSTLVSCSAEEVKIWNIDNKQCIKTIKTERPCVCEFVHNGELVLVGTKAGSLQLIDVKSSRITLFSNAHTAQITSLQMLPGTNIFMTASKDKTVKLWEFSANVGGYPQNDLLPILRKTLNLNEEVSYAKISPNGKLLAVALLDCTVKVLYTDTFKLFLSLYGHKLPITSIDISSDTSVIATASLDKTVKIWGLDFGDCRKNFLAHEEPVTHCKFVHGTYHLFSTGRDRVLKYWDAEKLDLISKLPSHHSDIWALAISKYGNFVVTGSDDTSIRIWRKTDDMFALHEERRAELDKLYEEEIKNAKMTFSGLVGQDAVHYDYRQQPDVSHEMEQVVKSDIYQDPEGNEIIDALDIYEIDCAVMEEYYISKEADANAPPPQRNPFVMALGDPLIPPELYVLSRLESLRPSTLENALIVLPYVKIISLLRCIDFWSKSQRSLILVARTLLFLLHLNQSQIGSSPSLTPIISDIRKNLAEKLVFQRDLIGQNISALSFLAESTQARSVTLDEG